jgi:hypothetical protein
VLTQATSRGERTGNVERIEAVIADARTALETLELAAASNQPDAFDTARTRFESLRNRATQLLGQIRNRAAIPPAALARVEVALEELDETRLPPRPDGVTRVDAEDALDELRTAVDRSGTSRYEWHRQINEKALAIVATMSRADSDVMLRRLSRLSERDLVARWLASRVVVDEILRTLRDPKRRFAVAVTPRDC